MILDLSFMSYSMAPRPPTPPPSSSKMSQIVRAIKIMASVIQQQNITIAQNHQLAMHHWEAARFVVNTPSASHSHEQMGLAEFLKHNPSKFNGSVTLDQAYQRIRELEKILRATSCPEEKKIIFATCCLGDGVLVDENSTDDGSER